MRNMIAFFSGIVMAAGLMMSGMVNPRVVLGFLDVTGDFNPSLMFVMIGGLTVAFIGFRLFLRRGNPILAPEFDAPSKTSIDAPLVIGAAIFGIGWGLAGLCPSPAIVSAGLGYEQSLIFVVMMIIGMTAVRIITGWK